MTRNDIADELRRVTDGQAFITISQLAKAFGRSNPAKVKKSFLGELEAVDGKYYLIREVADVLKKRCEG